MAGVQTDNSQAPLDDATQQANFGGLGMARASASPQSSAPVQGLGNAPGNTANPNAPSPNVLSYAPWIAGMPGGTQLVQQLQNQYSAMSQGQSPTDQSSQYYRRDPVNGQAWLTTPGSPTGYAYGATTPQAGVDQRAWSNVYDPNAYQYGGTPGGAASEEQRYAQMGQAAAGNAAPQMNLSQFNALQGGIGAAGNTAATNALNMAQQNAMGNGPDIAGAAMQAGIGASQRAQFQQAAQARGGGANLVAAEQAAAMGASNTQSNVVGQGAVNSLQQQLAYQQQYAQQANQLQQAYGQQGNMLGNLAYQQAGLQAGQNQLNQAGQLAYEQMRQGVFNQQMTGQMAGEAQNAQTGLSAAQLAWQQQNANNQWAHQLIGAGLTAAGALAGTAVGGPAGGMAGAAAGGAAAKAAGG